jgi:hypothetical protein
LRCFSAPAAAAGGGEGPYGSGTVFTLGDFGLAMMQGSGGRRAGLSEGDSRYGSLQTLYRTRNNHMGT